MGSPALTDRFNRQDAVNRYNHYKATPSGPPKPVLQEEPFFQ